MARLIRRFSPIALITLIAACGGDDKKPVLCDGGACTDAKTDVSAKLDALVKQDVPTTKSDVATTPDLPVGPDTADTSTPTMDTAVSEAPAPVDTIVPTPDTRPPADQAQDVSISPDGGIDAPIPPIDAGAELDGGAIDANMEDAPAVALDTAAMDTAAMDAGMPQLDAESEAGSVDGGCIGVLCADFEGDEPDAGTSPAGWTVVGNGTGWTVAYDGTDRVLQQDTRSNLVSYIRTGSSSWTDVTITVNVKLLSVGNNDSVRICGRFAVPSLDSYCLYVSSGDTGATPGSLSLQVRQNGTSTQMEGANATATDLPITLDTWHTYQLVISGAGPVDVSAYLDDASTPTVSATDDTAPYLTSGMFGIGTRNATANVDDLLITSP